MGAGLSDTTIRRSRPPSNSEGMLYNANIPNTFASRSDAARS
jgi:hypothetical protein